MHSLPELPFSASALEPYIDTQTMQIHHGKHHQAYVDNLNKTLNGHDDLNGLTVEQLLARVSSLPESIRQAVVNHGGGHANHSLFWKTLIPPDQFTEPSGKLLETLNSTFGSFAKFKEVFTAKAMGVFGSGWAFLIKTTDGKLDLKRHSFQNSPLMHGNITLLGVDVWEHAYYLKYQNRRAEYLEAWWHIINWKQVESNLLG